MAARVAFLTWGKYNDDDDDDDDDVDDDGVKAVVAMIGHAIRCDAAMMVRGDSTDDI